MIDDRKFERPASPHAEQTILGAMLFDPAAVADALDALQSSDFALDSHQRIFSAMKKLAAAHQAVDIVTLTDALKRARELDSIGGSAYVFALTEGLPRRLSIENYIRIVRDKARLREAQIIADSLLTETSDQSLDSEEVITKALQQLRELSEDTSESRLQAARDLLPGNTVNAPLAESFQVHDGIPYGFKELDELTGGAQKSDLIIIAARPSMGKTALLCAIVAHQAITLTRHVAVFTAEQKSLAILRRILAARARLDYQEIRNGTLRHYDEELLLEHSRVLAAAPLFLDDQPKPTVTRIRSRAMRLQRDLKREGHTLDCILIDQLSKISHADLSDRRAPRHERVGEITAGLKALAQELDLPIILLVQIGREGGKRADRPQLTDLKDSGNIEEDADVVLFPHRPEYYDKTDTSLAGKGELILAKQREGPTGICNVLYNGRIMRWEDEDQQPPAAKTQGIDFGRLIHQQQEKGY